MFEGKSLLEYFRLQHLLTGKNGRMSITEYNALLPWMLDVEVSMIQQDQEEEKNRRRGQEPGLF